MGNFRDFSRALTDNLKIYTADAVRSIEKKTNLRSATSSLGWHCYTSEVLRVLLACCVDAVSCLRESKFGLPWFSRKNDPVDILMN